MIFRRVKAHIEKENWFAVFIDFIIVVIGVFIGLQVANWNDALGERQRETQILRNIATDLRADIEDYSKHIDSDVTKIVIINHILDNASVPQGQMLTDKLEIDGMVFADFFEQYLESGDKGLAQRLEPRRNELWSVAVLVPNAAPSTTAFDSLVSSGDLGILRDEAIVESLQTYRQLMTAIIKAQEVTFRPRRDNAIDIGLEFGLSPFRATEESEFLALVSGSPKLAATVQSQLGWARGHLTMLAGAHNRAKLALSQIENKLG
ncbi:MAG: hypothetical protein AB8G18_07755, partial [Gammaproteobacteria bacterium]